MDKQEQLKGLTVIPGVGLKVARYFWEVGIKRVADLRGKDPEGFYLAMCVKKGYRVNRCMLYIFRCAVYFAENKIHDPQKLKWWNWKPAKGRGKRAENR